MHHKHRGKHLISNTKRKITFGLTHEFYRISYCINVKLSHFLRAVSKRAIQIAKSVQHDHLPLASLSELIHLQ